MDSDLVRKCPLSVITMRLNAEICNGHGTFPDKFSFSDPPSPTALPTDRAFRPALTEMQTVLSLMPRDHQKMARSPRSVPCWFWATGAQEPGAQRVAAGLRWRRAEVALPSAAWRSSAATGFVKCTSKPAAVALRRSSG